MAASCGGGSSSTPTQPGQPSQPSSSTGILRGVVTEILTGTPVEGATIAFKQPAGTTTVTSGAGGAWEFTQQATTTGSIPIEVTAAGFVTRLTYVKWGAGTRGDIKIDLIRDSQPFSMSYYRELVRNMFSAPEAQPEPLRRWTTTPNFYINTTTPSTGESITPGELDMLIATIRAAVPQMTGGQFEAGQIETGTIDRQQKGGYIDVKFISDASSEFCGQAFIGANPGTITINYGVTGCKTTCGNFAPRTVAHEVGHAMGFFHVAEGSVMNTVWYDRDCANKTFSAAEQHHARVAYGRSLFNRDPDNDPTSTLLLEAPGGTPMKISCR